MGPSPIDRQLANLMEESLRLCMRSDERLLRRRLRGLQRGRRSDRGGREGMKRLETELAQAVDRCARREEGRPKANFPQELPILERRAEIAAAISENQVVVICGETGSGKSTQLPKICLDVGRGADGFIGHTQPRRIAARSIAARVARELNTQLGQAVGYKVRFNDRTSRDAYVKVMTDGILLAETQGDRDLDQYDTIIIDEAHERGLNVDFLLGYLRQLLPRRRDLKLIITSATIDPHRFSEHFNDAPVIEVTGRTHPVDVRYRPLTSDDPDEKDRDQLQAILHAVDELAAIGKGDVLVFLAGEREIRETAEALRKHHPPGTEILPLFARLSADEQNRIFEAHSGRRIVLATNVAETSLTVPGIRYVVDPGTARISRYSARSKVQRLPVEPISRASAKQRAGRCGRLGPGVCIRLYSEDEHDARDEYTQPEILRTNLAAVILQMKALSLGDVRAFPFIEPPRKGMIRDGFDTLHELGAVDEKDRLTDLGRRLARLPIDPRIARMILAADGEKCLSEVLIIAAALSIQDPRERPMDQQDAADAAHEQFVDEESDFLGFLKLWAFFHERKKHLSWSKLRACCRDNFLSFLRMREWHDIHQQLRTLVTQAGMHPNEQPADYAAIHCALLTGLLSNIARQGDNHEYEGARGSKCYIFPGSGQFKAGPKWFVAAEIVETTRRYARCVAGVRPRWIERAGAHLARHTYFKPHWSRRAAEAYVYERVSLLGLELVEKRRVKYGPIDPKAARDLFIHQALVEGYYDTDAAFFAHNRALIEEIRTIEAKRRRRDVLVEIEAQYRFYDKRVPLNIYSGRAFEQWRRKAEREKPGLLHMSRRHLVRRGAPEIEPSQFPDALELDDAKLPLTYHHEPGATDDGVTVTAPLALLNQLSRRRLDWLVPGMLREKLVALIKTLPREIRRNYVPAPDFAKACVDRMEFGEGDLIDAFSDELHRMTGIAALREDWKIDALPDHLKMNVRLVDENGQEVARGRDLDALRKAHAPTARQSFSRFADDRFRREGIREWDFEDLPESVQIADEDLKLRAHPALLDRGESVALSVMESPESARAAMRSGLRRLFMLQLGDELTMEIDHLPGIDDLRRHFAPMGESAELNEQLAMLTADRAFLADDPDIRTKSHFDQRLKEGWQQLWPAGCEAAETAGKIGAAYHKVMLRLEAFGAPVWTEAVNDVRFHLSTLLPRRFLVDTPFRRLSSFPRYLRGVELRLERLPHGGHRRDREKAGELNALWMEYTARRDDHESRGVCDPALEEYRWMLEEMRVSMFAQELGTLVPVSAKRLAAQWRKVRA